MDKNNEFRDIANNVFFGNACSILPNSQNSTNVTEGDKNSTNSTTSNQTNPLKDNEINTECESLLNKNMVLGLQNTQMQILKEFKILNEQLDQDMRNQDVIGTSTYRDIGKRYYNNITYTRPGDKQTQHHDYR